jgi:cell shape-determining protein MreD
MVSQYLKIFFFLVFGWLLVMFQLGFINGLLSLVSGANLVIVILIFILGLKNGKEAFVWALWLGVLLDIFSFYFFGLYTISLSLTVFFSYFLLDRFFTNRSLYSFLTLVLFADLFFRLLIFIFVYLFSLFGVLNFVLVSNWWLRQSHGIAVDLFLTIIIFYGLNLISRNLKPVFLFRKRRR